MWKMSAHEGVSLHLETHGNHLVCGHENVVDGTWYFLRIHIQAQWLFQHLTFDQMHFCAKVPVPGVNFPRWFSFTATNSL